MKYSRSRTLEFTLAHFVLEGVHVLVKCLLVVCYSEMFVGCLLVKCLLVVCYSEMFVGCLL